MPAARSRRWPSEPAPRVLPERRVVANADLQRADRSSLTTQLSPGAPPSDPPELASATRVSWQGTEGGNQLLTTAPPWSSSPSARLEPIQVLSDALRARARFGERGRFEFCQVLGQGGLGMVFQVTDHELQREVAAKFFLSAGDAEVVPIDQLRLEARATAKLNHPNIVAVHDIGDYWGIPYLLMEYVPGESLQDRLQRGTLAPLKAIAIAAQVVRALRYAHRAGVLHLDLKPSNILLSAGRRVKLIDFGTAGILLGRQHESVESPMMSRVMGTPAYMAPEQWLMTLPDERCDVWAVGALLFQMLTGELPFSEDEIQKRRSNSALETPYRVPTHWRIPRPIEPVLTRALALRAAERYQSAAELLRALRQAEQNLASSRSLTA